MRIHSRPKRLSHLQGALRGCGSLGLQRLSAKCSPRLRNGWEDASRVARARTCSASSRPALLRSPQARPILAPAAQQWGPLRRLRGRARFTTPRSQCRAPAHQCISMVHQAFPAAVGAASASPWSGAGSAGGGRGAARLRFMLPAVPAAARSEAGVHSCREPWGPTAPWRGQLRVCRGMLAPGFVERQRERSITPTQPHKV